MGFHVSTLHNLPVGSIQYFIHVVDMSGGEHGRWINENLHALAASLGRDAGLVTGPRNLSYELHQFLSRNLSSGFGAVEGLLHSATCLLISEGHLAHTQKPVHLIPIATPQVSESAHELIATLIGMIANALRTGQLQDLVISLGAHEFQLSSAGGGFVVCTLRRLNKVLELKPNVAGLGLNLNGTIEALLPPEARPI
ncbi:hypothetical protein J2W35_001329 [Variovorax boronicumulans]|uniref:hypothetical protein n=1 Tax=Variovorax boronicumulans TaxID=436515 RepID=UPI00277F31E0|nr:hypothetical protein [Variovorax boronicumulans]MDQ0080992.1 hypothetical protein [Variovorax boronicumulans]